jgi:beta-galactosidase
MKKIRFSLIGLVIAFGIAACKPSDKDIRVSENFNDDWSFILGDEAGAADIAYNDSGWRKLSVPHDWSIEGSFSSTHPATAGGGALPGGIGWYRKSFLLPGSDSVKNIFIDFDGVYRCSEVYINGHRLGMRPNGYISFRYDLTPYLNFRTEINVIAVKVDNSKQPNSRWYSGSGIYRNVRLVKTSQYFVDLWGTNITTPKIESAHAEVVVRSTIRNSSDAASALEIVTSLYNADGKKVGSESTALNLQGNASEEIRQDLQVAQPRLWSVKDPYLYKAVTRVIRNGKIQDTYETPFGIRSFYFDSLKGFFLNGQQVKINGVCNHHDLGCLGAAVNSRAIERQLEILKGMGCNGIRTSHNPPAPELLDLCDKMGFIVMDEAFDIWEKQKSPFDYALYWKEWHEKDLRDQILRDRNHPSVCMEHRQRDP